MRLYFIYMNGCGACEGAKPIVKRWQRKHPEVEVKWIDLLTAKWSYPAWQPRATPTYVAETLGRPKVMHEGALSEAQMDGFMADARKKMGL